MSSNSDFINVLNVWARKEYGKKLLKYSFFCFFFLLKIKDTFQHN